jgi:hypothetical protein
LSGFLSDDDFRKRTGYTQPATQWAKPLAAIDADERRQAEAGASIHETPPNECAGPMIQ